jgi:hypothetical protein
MFFGIDRARFLTRQVLGGERHRDVVRAVAPAIEGKLLYLCQARGGCRPAAVRAGGEIPSRARMLGAGLELRAGTWRDTPADSTYITPTAQQLYDELDRFHLPRRPDSTWGEWHYFNLVPRPDEWWYLTYRVNGEVPTGRWGGEILLTHRRPDGRYERFTAQAPANEVALDTAGADLAIGPSSVRQRRGRYHLVARARGAVGLARLYLTLTPAPNRYFPPVELREEFRSGYVVPALAAEASGTICVAHRCTMVNAAPAYHDHNWGVWRNVTWEWGAARGRELGLLYGGVYGPDREVASPFFLTVADSLGVVQVLRFDRVEYRGAMRVESGGADMTAVTAPGSFHLTAAREQDTLRHDVRVEHALASRLRAAGLRRYFLQMRGSFALHGRLGGAMVRDSGQGFFETYVSR